MIRAGSTFARNHRRAWSCSMSSGYAPKTHLASQQCGRTFCSVALNVSVENEEAFPPNLTIDRKSSFAPKQTTVLVPLSEPEPDDEAESATAEADSDTSKDSGVEADVDYDDNDSDEHVDDTWEAPRYVVPLPDRLKASVRHGLDGSVAGTIHLDSSVFGVDPIRFDLIKQSVDYVRNKIRGRRKAKTKTIGEVRGSGRKVRQQKGTGKARAGHSRPAHWRGGAKAHGPKNTVDYGNVKMNKKTRRLAMVSVLSQKLKEGNLIVVDYLQLESHKTSHWADFLDSAFGVGKDGSSALILDRYHESDTADQEDEDFHASFNGVPINLWVASGNIYKIKVANQRYANIYEILRKEKLILTLSALEQVEARWKE